MDYNAGYSCEIKRQRAHRWMACPPSANLETQFPDKSSSFAEEGTFAHSLAELVLRYNNHEITKKAFNTRLNKMKKEPLFSQDMLEYIDGYAHQVWEQVNEAKASCPDAQALFEQRLDFSDYVPEGFGTGDVVIIADDMIQVIDLEVRKRRGRVCRGESAAAAVWAWSLLGAFPAVRYPACADDHHPASAG